MQKPAQKRRIKPGDRVAERPKANYIPGLKPGVRERISSCMKQRYGTVIEVYTKRPRTSNRATKYAKVLWDGSKTPSDHAQMRLIHEEYLPELLSVYAESIHF